MTEGQQFSGAAIRFLIDGTVAKTSADPEIQRRLQQQAHYMQWLNTNCYICPQIVSIEHDGYIMQRCEEFAPFSSTAFGSTWLMTMKQTLDTFVWSRSPATDQDPSWFNNILTYVDQTLYGTRCPEELRKGASTFMHEAFFMGHPECAVHGDATLDNLLYGHLGGSAYLLVSDPLPPDKRIPNDRAVDLGKMLQSAMGWEDVKRGGTWFQDPSTGIQAVIAGEEPEIVVRSYAWLLIHLIRIMPYAFKAQNEHLKREVSGLIKSIIRNTQHGVRSTTSE